MGGRKIRTSWRSLVLSALLALCLIGGVSLVEMNRGQLPALAAVGATPSAVAGPWTPAPAPASIPAGSADARPLPSTAGTGSPPVIEAASASTSTSSCSGLADPPDGSGAGRIIRGVGRIESKRENVAVGTLVAGVVAEVFVQRGDVVKKGDPLFRIDDRDFRSQLGIATANLAAVEAQYDRLQIAPHLGDVTASEAAVAEARAHLSDAELTFRRSQSLFDRRVESAQDRDRDRFAYIASKAAVARLEADLKRLKSTWDKDKEMARTAVEQAKRQVESVQVNLSRVIVRAAVDGRVLRVQVRPGQFAGAAWNEPLVTLGDDRELVLRVDVDEADLPDFSPRSRAVATLRGQPGVKLPLTYFDTDPSLISRPSTSVSADGPHERRVLPVLYVLPRQSPIRLYAGQDMDVAIAPAARGEGAIAPAPRPAIADNPFDQGHSGPSGPRSEAARPSSSRNPADS